MNKSIEKVLVTKAQLKKKVKELADQISKDYKNKELVLVCVLKGGFVFMADLMRELSIPVEVDFISVSSYGKSSESTGIVRIMKDIDINIIDKHVLIVEDLVDTGLTLDYLKELLIARDPMSVKICTILDKPSRRKINIKIDYKGIEIPNKFVVGYGLDFADKFRNLQDVCSLLPHLYEDSDFENGK